jgi:hypothetical protein
MSNRALQVAPATVVDIERALPTPLGDARDDPAAGRRLPDADRGGHSTSRMSEIT